MNSPIMQSAMLVAGLDKRRREYKHAGWVYAARNPCFVDAVFKIGQTKASPTQRVEKLSASTSVYRKFQLVYFIHVSDRTQAEGYVHHILGASRINPSKEFFKAPLMKVVAALDEAGWRWRIQRGRSMRAGFWEPALQPRAITCRRCGGKISAPRLLIEVRATCKRCSASFKVPSDVAG